MKLISLYLPQFHPIPENDNWWGKGFTEWTNVTRAKPLFRGHYQPHLPADLGFYDLRLSESRIAQADLAREYGIYGFCYYHYWFNGKRLLNRPIDEVLALGEPDFPFMLCWANENWTRRWDGQESQILMKQDYSDQDDILHIRFLAKVFEDKRYIRVNGKPFFVIYKPNLFPDIRRTIDLWRSEAIKLGIGELYLGYMHSPYTSKDVFKFEDGFDAAVEFSPHGNRPTAYDLKLNQKVSLDNFFPKLKRRIIGDYKSYILGQTVSSGQRRQYVDWIKTYFQQTKVPFKLFPSVFPNWDNTARKKSKANIVLGSTPNLYKDWLTRVVKEFEPYSPDEDFVFINAWNEWAEGNHLEPCQKWGRQYLEATRDSLIANNIPLPGK